MIIAIIACVVLIVMLCMLFFTLATYALPFMLGLEVARFAYHTGSGFLGAVLVGTVAGAAVFGLAFLLLGIVRSPCFRSSWRSSTPRPPSSRAMPSSTASPMNTSHRTFGGNCSASRVVCSLAFRRCCG